MSWLQDHPEISSIRVAAADLNGQARGKRIAVRFSAKVEKDGIRMPLSALNLDILGEDIASSPMVFESGDGDGVLKPTERGFVPMPWLASPSALLPVWAFQENGDAFQGDPRQALAQIVGRYHAHGWVPVVATELEFYLFENENSPLHAPASPDNGQKRTGSDILDLQVLDGFENFFSDLYAACEAMDIPAVAATSEAGPGQFEVNLIHAADALRAADDVWMFKMLTKGMARKHGMAASFMAKPYPNSAGNGLHTHFSVLDRHGGNIFADGENGAAALKHAVAGCLKHMHDSSLVFAPYGNSYARFASRAHAPINICWGHENRTAAIRIPGGDPAARRIEHRVCGGDINPYLMLAAVLGAALLGLEERLEPPAPIIGNAYDSDLPQMALSWEAAIEALETSSLLPKIFPKILIQNLALTKRQEMRVFAELSDEEITKMTVDSV